MDMEIEWEDKPSSTFTTTPIDISTTDVFDKVLNLREIWIPRSSDFPF